MNTYISFKVINSKCGVDINWSKILKFQNHIEIGSRKVQFYYLLFVYLRNFNQYMVMLKVTQCYTSNEAKISFRKIQWTVHSQISETLCGLFRWGLSTQQDIGWRMKKCIKANPFIGTTGTGLELCWKVTPVHCCIEFCWIGEKIWHLSIKDGLLPSNFQLTNSANILDN